MDNTSKINLNIVNNTIIITNSINYTINKDLLKNNIIKALNIIPEFFIITVDINNNVKIKIESKTQTPKLIIDNLKNKIINVDLDKIFADTYIDSLKDVTTNSVELSNDIIKSSTVTNNLDNSWDNIKNNIAEVNGVTMNSSFNPNLTYTNEDIIVMFIFKLSDRYRYSSLVDFGLLNDLDRLFIESYDSKVNYLNYAVPKVENYLSDIKKKIDQLKSTKDVKSKPLIFNLETFEDLKIDSYLLAAAVPQLTNLAKYRYLAKLLYEKDKKYLDLAKESIMLQNNNISLDMMVFGSDNLTKKIIQTTSVEHFNNKPTGNSNTKNILIICIILVIIILIKN